MKERVYFLLVWMVLLLTPAVFKTEDDRTFTRLPFTHGIRQRVAMVEILISTSPYQNP